MLLPGSRFAASMLLLAGLAGAQVRAPRYSTAAGSYLPHDTDPADARFGWTPLEGRFRAVFLHPVDSGVRFAIREDGKLLRSADRGGNWQRMTDPFPGQQPHSVAVAAGEPDVIYVESAGFSVVRSFDGGESWARADWGIEESGQADEAAGMVVDPLDGRTLYLGGRSLWVSRDGGESWKRAAGPLETSTFTAVAAAVDGEHSVVLAGTGEGDIFSGSLELGAPRRGRIAALVFDPLNARTVYAAYSTPKEGAEAQIYRSGDGGRAWMPVDGTEPAAIPRTGVNSLAVDPEDSAHLWAATDLGVYVSPDGGASWLAEHTGFRGPARGLVLEPGMGTTLDVANEEGEGYRVSDGGQPAFCHSLNATSATVGSQGGEVVVTATPRRPCAWRASSPVTWAAVSPTLGVGAGTIRIQVQANSSGATRSAAVRIAGQDFRLTQNGASSGSGNCVRIDVDFGNTQFSASGGTGTIRITAWLNSTTGSGCAWSISAPSWVHPEVSSGVNCRVVTYTVDPNTSSAARTGTLTVAGRSATIQQAGQASATCTYRLSSTQVNISSSTASVNVETQAGCRWEFSGPFTTAETRSWIRLVSGQSGTGPGQIVLAAMAQTWSSRMAWGLVNASGYSQRVEFYQRGAAPEPVTGPACNPTVIDADMHLSTNGSGWLTVPLSGGSYVLRVSAPAHCRWRLAVVPDATWVLFTDYPEGVGMGAINYTVRPASSQRRIGIYSPEDEGNPLADRDRDFPQVRGSLMKIYQQ